MQVTVWDVPAEKVVFQLPKSKDWCCDVSFSSAWLATSCFGSSEVALIPVEDRQGLSTFGCGVATGREDGGGFHDADSAEAVCVPDRERSGTSILRGVPPSCGGSARTSVADRLPSNLPTRQSLKSMGTVRAGQRGAVLLTRHRRQALSGGA